MASILRSTGEELKRHAPFTLLGTITAMVLMGIVIGLRMPRYWSQALFWFLHPLHVLFSAIATTSMFRLRGKRGLRAAVLVGYVGSIGIATLSDSIVPYVGEMILDCPARGLHLGFLEKWWLVNPLAAIGIAIGYWRPQTALPHAGHVLLSTWASLFHLHFAMTDMPTLPAAALISLFLFMAVWLPCCTSDIAFPLLFARRKRRAPR